jgi:crotonobetainyl-CoA:carnitine CoA-transferase CaiB-like acyl-CoA transferase
MSALEGIRVVDLSGSIATAYCSKLFADYGADVVCLEPPEGFATRRMGPFTRIDGSPGPSALHAYLNTNKRSLVRAAPGEPADAPGRLDDAAVQALLAGADVVIDDGSSAIAVSDAIHSRISWFGPAGPYAGFQGSDGACFALSGMLRGIGDAAGPPLIPQGYQAQIIGGLTAFIGTLSHVIGRVLGNRPRRPVTLDTSILESVMCFTEVGCVGFYNTGIVGARRGVNRFPPTYPLGIFPCRDGWLGVTVLTPSQWQSFCALLGLDDFAREPRYHSTLERLADVDVLEPVIKAKLAGRSAQELFYAGQRAGVPLALVPTMAELFDVDQYRSRESFAAISVPGGASFLAPVVPYRLHATPPLAPRESPWERSPDRDATPLREQPSSSEQSASWQQSRWERSPDRDRPTSEPALSGIRVIDLTMGWAGPLATRHLADMGAQIIKVESCERFDWWRSWEATPQWIADDGAEKSVSFNTVNRNKLAITLDLEHPDGRRLLLELVAGADVVVENFSAGVLPKLQLDYPYLREANPEIVMLSMPAFGNSGPWRSFRAYGSTVEHASGLPHLNGGAHHPPAMHHVAYGDAVGGLNGAAALLTALHHRARTGRGQYLDLSQAECLFPLGVHGILQQSATGVAPARYGNDHPDHAPFGVYPCAGEDAWICIQVSTEEQWRQLRDLAGASLADFAGGLEQRLRERDRLNAALGDWCRSHPADALMMQLQRAGVPAAAVHDVRQVLEDPHLQARGVWQWLDRAVVGVQPNPSTPYREGTDPYRIRTPAPTLGQHNEQVLSELGLAAADIADLAARGIIGNRPRMPGSSRAS